MEGIKENKAMNDHIKKKHEIREIYAKLKTTQDVAHLYFNIMAMDQFGCVNVPSMDGRHI